MTAATNKCSSLWRRGYLYEQEYTKEVLLQMEPEWAKRERGETSVVTAYFYWLLLVPMERTVSIVKQ